MSSTLITQTPEVSVTSEEWNPDNERYCIVDDNRPTHSLCGLRFNPDWPELPAGEVPDEVTCPDCLVVQAMVQTNSRAYDCPY